MLSPNKKTTVNMRMFAFSSIVLFSMNSVHASTLTRVPAGMTELCYMTKPGSS